MSIVGVSETLSHNASTVFGMMKKMIPIIKEHYPDLTFVHYLTDSPTSQYRNKAISRCLCDHEEEFGIPAAWDYLEAGHGKGPCDGLGASVKRSADMAIKQSKAIIQSAGEFFRWAVDVNATSVTYFFLSQEEYDRAHLYLQEKTRGVKPVPGTMKIYAVFPISKTSVVVRQMSCHCASCKCILTTTCSGWEFHTICTAEENSDSNVETASETENEPDSPEDSSCIVPEIDEYIAAMYDENYYIGVVKDTDDSEATISFMARAGKVEGCFRWPTPPDEIWVEFSDNIMRIPPPVPSGKTKRVYKMVDDMVLSALELQAQKKRLEKKVTRK